MLRIIVALIVFIHGLIHLLGFVKEWQLFQVKELSGKTLLPITGNLSKIIGLIWLLVFLLFVLCGFLYLSGKAWWWIVALTAMLLSQVLIILYWPDAKFGTVANIIILIAGLLSYGTWSFNRMVDGEIKSYLPTSSIESAIITTDFTGQLPPLVQKWLERSGLIGKEKINTVHLKQKGEMRTKPEGDWMSFEAEQYFTIEEPAFIWIAKVHAAPFIHLAGRDKYQNGQGHMLIKLLSLFPVAEARGETIDQGTLVRFLAETVWFPSVAWSDYLTWQEIDSSRAKVTMNYKGVTATAMMQFSMDGDFISFEAQRYFDRKEGPTLETWYVEADQQGYKEFNEVRIPCKCSVTWKLRDGDFTWLRLEITDIKYNALTH